MTALLVPLLLAAAGIFALSRRVDAFSAMLTGAREGLNIVAGILPSLVVLLSGVAMLRASGALDALARLLSPLLSALGLPAETAPLMLLRPFSGGGALAAGSELIERFGPDSTLGRIAAVMLGSTETTFYVITVYFGAARVKRPRHAIPTALAADLTGFVMAAATVRWFFG